MISPPGGGFRRPGRHTAYSGRMTDSTEPEHAAPPDPAADLSAFRVRYSHDNPPYTHPITKQLIDPEGLVEDSDVILAVSADEAEEQVAQLHWADQDFTILGVDTITLEEAQSA